MDFLKKIVPVLMVAFFASGCATAISGKKKPGGFQVKMKHVKVTPNITEVGVVKGECTKHRVLCFSFGAEKQADGVVFDRVKADDYTTKWWFLGGAYGAVIYLGREYQRQDAAYGTDYQRAAAFDAAQKAGVDVIINPQYVIEKTEGLFDITETVTCRIEGVGARINSIDKIEYVMPPEPELGMLEALKAKVQPDKPEEDGEEKPGAIKRMICPYLFFGGIIDHWKDDERSVPAKIVDPYGIVHDAFEDEEAISGQ